MEVDDKGVREAEGMLRVLFVRRSGALGANVLVYWEILSLLWNGSTAFFLEHRLGPHQLRDQGLRRHIDCSTGR